MKTVIPVKNGVCGAVDLCVNAHTKKCRKDSAMDDDFVICEYFYVEDPHATQSDT